MGSGPVDPRELLKGLDCFLGKDGEVRSSEGVSKIFSLMKTSQKMVSRCIYLNILLQTKSQDILNRFIKIGGYKLLNSWLTYSKTTNNTPLLHLILLTLQNLPLKVDHLKQNFESRLRCWLKAGWRSFEPRAELRQQLLLPLQVWIFLSFISSCTVLPLATTFALQEDKKKKEEGKGKAAPEKTETKPDLKGAEAKAEEDKRKEKPKVQRTTAPSHAKFRSTGLEVDTPTPVPVKKVPPPMQVGDKYNIKPAPVKRQNSGLGPDMQPVEKKYKPLNTTPNMIKEIKVKIIPAQPIESPGFLEALNSAPVTGVKIKKKKKAVSPTSNKSCPFDIKPNLEPSPVKQLSLDSSPTASVETMELEQPGTPVPAEEIPENMDTAPEEPNALAEPRGEETAAADTVKLTKKGKKKKNVRWAEENHLRKYFFFELDETERVNVNKIKDFGEAAKREMMMDRQAFESARRHSHDAMEEKVPWSCPWPLDLPHTLVVPGSGSQEKVTQQEREKGILQEIFLSKESVPDSPHEPDPESYEPLPPKLIPLDEDSSAMEDGYSDPMDTTPASHSPDVSGAKLPTVLANLMGSMGASRSPQQPGSGVVPPVNVQELLSTIMLLIKITPGVVLFSVGSGLLGMGPGMNGGFPPGPKSGPHFHPHGGPGGHFPPHNGPGGPPGGPRMMGPPPPQQHGGEGYWKPPGEPMRGGPHGMRGGPFHRGRGGRGENPSFRGRPGRGSSGPPRRGGPNNSHMGDMSNRDVCRHFMMKGSCRYENNCAFYHPGVNVNVNKIKDFGEAAKREMMMDRQAFESARRHSHDAMEEKVPWSCPWPLDLPHTLVVPGSGSQEKFTQQEREKGILQEIFLSKESVPDSPHEPDPESYEPLPPKLIPLDEDSSAMEDGYSDPMDTTPASHSPDVSGAKLPTVLANLMGSMGASRSPQQPGSGVVPPVNVQELLSTIMLLIKITPGVVLFSVGSGLLGMGPGMNGGFPPGPKNGPHFHPHGGPGGHFPPHNGPGGPPGGPRMMGPPPPQQHGGEGYWKPPGEPMRGGPHGMRGGPFHRGRGGRGENPSFRGRPGRGSSGPPRRGGPNNSHMGDMSNRDVCRHFMMKGSCRYENNCAFYHPGVNGPPLP
ncbi:UNVERIFIED_CONTAM: hypothetical protein FKN15_051193 [Acipenser sinensis]